MISSIKKLLLSRVEEVDVDVDVDDFDSLACEGSMVPVAMILKLG
jgi:hypothetical protein